MANGDTSSTHVQYSEVATTGAGQPTPPPSGGGLGSDDNATPGAGGDGALPPVAKPSVVRSFVRLLRDNGAFRALWVAGFISNVGDWFNEVAIIALLQRLDGSNMLPIAAVMVGRMVPFVVLSPIVGWLADRCNRLHLMLGCDVARGLLVLALAAANTHTTLAALVVLKSLMSALAAQFEPCRSAIVPQLVTSADDLVVANAMDGTMYATTQFLGGALGGLVTAWAGTQACFILDSASYFGSALCVCAIMAALRSRREYAPVGEDKTGVEMAPTGSATRDTDVDTEDANATLTDPSATASSSARHNEGLCSSMSGGLAYLWAHKDLLFVSMFKALSNVPLAGASISVPAMVERVFPISTALGVGLSYGGEAVGTAVSPIMLPWTGSNVRRMRAALGLSFLIGGVGFALDVVAPLLGAIGFAVLLAGQIVSGFAWSLQYIYTQSLLQLGTPDWVRGRVFAFSLAIRTCISIPGLLATGWLLDGGGLTGSQAMMVVSVFNGLLGALYGLCYYPLYKDVGQTPAVVAAPAKAAECVKSECEIDAEEHRGGAVV